MNLVTMTDEELDEHIARLVRVVEEKNVLVGAILRAELDAFLKDLREETIKAQPKPKDWLDIARITFEDKANGEKVEIQNNLRTGRQSVQVISPDHPHVEFDLPSDIRVVKYAPMPEKTASKEEDIPFELPKNVPTPLMDQLSPALKGAAEQLIVGNWKQGQYNNGTWVITTENTSTKPSWNNTDPPTFRFADYERAIERIRKELGKNHE